MASTTLFDWLLSIAMMTQEAAKQRREHPHVFSSDLAEITQQAISTFTIAA